MERRSPHRGVPVTAEGGHRGLPFRAAMNEINPVTNAPPGWVRVGCMIGEV